MSEKSRGDPVVGKSKNPLDPILKEPIDPRRVLKILECRRKIMKFVEAMLEAEISMDEFKVGEDLICQGDYDSIVQERYILKLCGYPLCSKPLEKEWKQRYHISVRDKRIYDVEIRKLYCSVKCMDISTKYRNDNLPELPTWMREFEDAKLDPNFEIQTSTL